MKYIASAYWEKGNVRLINEDSLLLLQSLTVRGRVLLAAVCDGMGGMEQGECASGYLTEELITWYYDNLIPAIGKKKPIWVIRRSFQRKLYQIFRRMEVYGNNHEIAMGTTMSVLVLWEKRYLIWHLGDCRIYCLTEKKGFVKGTVERKTVLLTKDHNADRNKLTKCVGSFVPYFVPDFTVGIIPREGTFLLCSDGFWHLIKEEEMEQVLSPKELTDERQIEKRLRELGKAAIRRGEKDNISALCIHTERGRR